MGADILEEPLALFGIGNDARKRQVGIVVNENLADIEDDVVDLVCHDVSCGQCFAKAVGIA
ncbi:hypothetical protein D3C87_1665970 [compost metagenome]